MGRVFAGLLGTSFLLANVAHAGDAGKPDRAGVEFFEARVRPVLAGHCFECHGARKQKGGLRLDSPDAVRAGGDNGPVVVAGEPEQSPLIEAVRQVGDVKMPPRGKLGAAEIDALTEWVKRGAPWPAASGVAVRPEAATAGKSITDADRAFWAFRPVKDTPPPAVRDADWPKSPVDAFVLAKLEEKGLHPSPQAGKRVLIRRATFDLIGLPPTPEEIEAFLKDDSPEAFAKVVDRLLASPRYGERWGRHWLDVARYGEDQAHSFQPRLYPNGFRYRDWVAQAFNADMPYRRFVIEQVAGDLLDEPGRVERLPALGFFALGPVYYGDPKKLDQVDDRIDTLSRGFLGLTVACARCHDHKFDPVPTQDYYALAGVFLSTEYQEAPAAPGEQVAAYDAAQAVVDAKAREIDEFLQFEWYRAHASEVVRPLLAALSLRAYRAGEPRPSADQVARREAVEPDRLGRWSTFLDRPREHARVLALTGLAALFEGTGGFGDGESRRVAEHAAEEFVAHVGNLLSRRDARADLDAKDRALLVSLFDEKGPLAVRKDRAEKELTAGPRARLAEARAERDRLQKAVPAKYPVVHTLRDGDQPADMTVLVRGSAATPGPKVPRHFLSILGGDSAPFKLGSGRLELARAIASVDNPLTARVMVNRVWQHHFGRGLVGTPSNFGKLGERPTHPELLDHLAHLFVAGGWSVKALHRVVLLSATYQQNGAPDSAALDVDPENRLLWRMSRRRLEVEAWRDAVLAVSGRLDPAVGGPSRGLDDPGNRRRTFYAAVSRHDLAPLLRLFDFPDPNITGAERTRTTVPLQALVVMNDEFLVESARGVAVRVRGAADDPDDARVQRAYALLFGRPASPREVKIGREYLSAADPAGANAGDLTRWERYAQALLATNEFLFVD